MALAYKARAMLAGLAKFGEPSSLAGTPCGPASIERNVEVYAGIGDTADDNPTVRRIVATVAAKPAYVDQMLGLDPGTTSGTYNPRAGQTLVHPSEGTFVLDRLLQDNGFTRRFIVAAG